MTPDSERAHGGPVLAIAAQGGRLWTSGRDKEAAMLREWSSQGRPSSSVTLGDLGSAQSCELTWHTNPLVHRGCRPTLSPWQSS